MANPTEPKVKAGASTGYASDTDTNYAPDTTPPIPANEPDTNYAKQAAAPAAVTQYAKNYVTDGIK